MATQSKKVRISARERRKFRIRKKVSGTDERPRLTVYRSTKHTHAQIISDVTGKTLATASTQDPEVMSLAASRSGEGAGAAKSAKSINAAWAVGVVIADRAKAVKVNSVVFDRNGFLYHGRIKALADGAREKGLDF
ncbi:MAG: 50S ribosomal protein L18 [Bdellovibrionota bacterium]|nr:MAG: 50S ribosomal protein L18 [Bdellovibrionota bacterium]